MDYTLDRRRRESGLRLESACKTYSARILISENTQVKLRAPTGCA